MAVCLTPGRGEREREEGRVTRDLSSLIVFTAQTQLSPPVTL